MKFRFEIPALGRASFTLAILFYAGVASADQSSMPTFADIKSADRASDLIFTDRNGERIDSLRTDPQVRKLAWTPLAQISPLARKILITTEDQHFFEHDGVDWFALAKNAIKYAEGNKARGASTITMQLVSLIEPSQAKHGKRGLREKWNQIEFALALEKIWTKDQILEAYLNLVPLRGEIVGIHAASEFIFHKDVSALNPLDASVLVAMLPAPNDSPSAIEKRACVFLKRDASLCEKLPAVIAQLSNPVEDLPSTGYSRFTESYVHSVYDRLDSVSTARAKRSGILQTSLDAKLESQVYRFAKETLGSLRDQNVSEIAAVVLKNDTGEVLAYLGNVPEFTKSPHVDGAASVRQAGSTLKPFFYLRALEDRKVDLRSTLNDSPEIIQTTNGAFRPENYDHEFHGEVGLPVALASSMNIPAIQIVEKIGEYEALETLKRFVFSRLKPAYIYGASIALGTVDVNLTTLTEAYRKLSLESLKSENAASIARILSDRDARVLTFGLTNSLNTPYYTAVKTGTSKDMRDNWCLGFSDRYTVGVWVGNFNGSPMRDVSGVSGAAPLWRRIMDELNDSQASRIPARVAAITLPSMSESREPKLSANKSLVRIKYPVDEAVLAYDPEISEAHQKVYFQVEGSPKDANWYLNGKKLASTDSVYFWPVSRGTYDLEVRSAQSDTPLDSVHFLVK